MNIIVSMIIPTFNVEYKILKRGLLSVYKQTYKEMEVIVVDDSTDLERSSYCKDLCDQFNFKFIHPENKLGLAASLNLGIEHSKGKYIARFDADDICTEERIAVQIKFLEENTEVDVLGSWLNIISKDGEILALKKYPQFNDEITIKMQYTNTIAHPSVIYKRNVVETFGKYNPKFTSAEDLEMWLRWMNNGVKFHNIQIPLVSYTQDQINRNFLNYWYNIIARLYNLSAKYFFHSFFGILLNFVWALTPSFFRSYFYKIKNFTN